MRKLVSVLCCFSAISELCCECSFSTNLCKWNARVIFIIAVANMAKSYSLYAPSFIVIELLCERTIRKISFTILVVYAVNAIQRTLLSIRTKQKQITKLMNSAVYFSQCDSIRSKMELWSKMKYLYFEENDNGCAWNCCSTHIQRDRGQMDETVMRNASIFR